MERLKMEQHTAFPKKQREDIQGYGQRRYYDNIRIRSPLTERADGSQDRAQVEAGQVPYVFRWSSATNSVTIFYAVITKFPSSDDRRAIASLPSLPFLDSYRQDRERYSTPFSHLGTY